MKPTRERKVQVFFLFFFRDASNTCSSEMEKIAWTNEFENETNKYQEMDPDYHERMCYWFGERSETERTNEIQVRRQIITVNILTTMNVQCTMCGANVFK